MKLIYLFLLLVLSACATTPFRDLAPDKKLSPTERIGVLVDVDDKPVHRHAGANPFIADYDRRYSFDWKLTQHIKDRFAERINTATKFQLIDLKDYGFELNDVTNLMVASEKEYVLNFRRNKTIAKLKDEFGLRTIVVFSSPGKTSMVNSCFQFSCRMSENIHTGLYTTAGSFTFYPVNDIEANIYVLDAPSDLAAAFEVRRAKSFENPALVKYKRPEDIRNITEKEWAPIKEAVVSSIDNYIDGMVRQMQANTQP